MSTTSGIAPGGVVESTGFTFTGDANIYYLEDDGKGVLKAFYISSSNKVYKSDTVGTVDYNKGEVILTSISISGIESYDGLTQTQLRITARPKSNDIVPVRNQILEIDLINMTVAGESDVVASGSSDGGTSYATSSSYD